MNNSCLNTAFLENNLMDVTDKSFENYFSEASFNSGNILVMHNSNFSYLPVLCREFKQIKADKSTLRMLELKERMTKEHTYKGINSYEKTDNPEQETGRRKSQLKCKKICKNIIRPLEKKLKESNKLKANYKSVKNKRRSNCEVNKPMKKNINFTDKFGVYGDLFYWYI